VSLDAYLTKSGVGKYSSPRTFTPFRTRRSPDVAIILGDRHEELKDAKVIPILPEVDAEVLSLSATPRMIHRKLKQYLPRRQRGLADRSRFTRGRNLDRPALPDLANSAGEGLVSALLPGFALPVTDLFA